MKKSASSLSTWVGVLLGAASVATVPAYAQQATGSSLGDQENLRLLAGGNVSTAIVTVDKRYEGVRGTPFLLPRWATGDILLTSNRRVAAVPLKFDVYNQRLMARRPQGDSIWLDLRNIQEFTLTDPQALPGQANLHRFARFSKFPVQAGRVSFLEVLHDVGPYLLLKRSGKSLLKANYQQAYSADRPYDELIDATEYFVLSPEGTFTALKPTLKSLIAAVPTALQEPLRAELKKTTIRTETDLFNAISHLNKVATARK